MIPQEPSDSAGPSASAGLVAERLLQVIDEGRRTATYKLALVLALMDSLAEAVDPRGNPPAMVHTRTIAEHVIRIYYPQVSPYHWPEDAGRSAALAGVANQAGILRQITMKRSVTLEAVLELSRKAEGRSLNRAISSLPGDYEACLDQVEQNFARMPILRLQNLGDVTREFLYSVDWGENVGLKKLHSPGGGMLVFRPGAATELLRLAPLVRPLVELHWTREVAKLNGLNHEGERLHTHLFGADRVAIPADLRSSLVELQGSACFYCGDRLRSAVEVDHFMPWSRWPNNAIENLVATDRRCNNSKRDSLASADHVNSWVTRLDRWGIDLASAASATSWETAPNRSTALVRAGYATAPTGTPLWVSVDAMVDDELALIRQRLASLR